VGLSTGVLRPAILRVAGHPWFHRLVTRSRPGRAVAHRFVAGEELSDAMRVARELDRKRITSMLDHLGEHADSREQEETARGAYLAALDRIAAEPTLDCAISVKLTQLGLERSPVECLANLRTILDRADLNGTLVMIDMEEHTLVDPTLEAFRRAHADHPRVGVALQAYLRRTERDLFSLPEGARVRLVKGAYLEPPEVVLGSRAEVDAAYRRLFTTLLGRGHPVDVATHDPRLIEAVRRRVDVVTGGWSRVEFQMLYGVRRDLQASLAERGYPVRVYIPYGTEWYPYLTRRLAERPANLWFFLSNLMRTSG
jgi:proline dehydrogenase